MFFLCCIIACISHIAHMSGPIWTPLYFAHCTLHVFQANSILQLPYEAKLPETTAASPPQALITRRLLYCVWWQSKKIYKICPVLLLPPFLMFSFTIYIFSSIFLVFTWLFFSCLARHTRGWCETARQPSNNPAQHHILFIVDPRVSRQPACFQQIGFWS